MKEAGCTKIFLGIESASNKILKRIQKGFTFKEARKDIELSKRFFTTIYTSYIWGFPYEDIDDFCDTLFSYIEDYNDEKLYPVLNLAIPFVSTELYNNYSTQLKYIEGIENGLLPKHDTLENYPDLKELVLKYPNLFTSFYYYKHDLFNSKIDIKRKMFKRSEAL